MQNPILDAPDDDRLKGLHNAAPHAVAAVVSID
jgi:hypothetical protein